MTTPSPADLVRDALRSALERLAYNYRLTLAGKPVRDVSETFAEVDAALAALAALATPPPDSSADLTAASQVDRCAESRDTPDYLRDLAIALMRLHDSPNVSTYGDESIWDAATALRRAAIAAEKKSAVGQSTEAQALRDAQPWREILAAVLREHPEQTWRRDGNAPGHGHDIPGIWDSDNGSLAGKPCAWCLTWKTAVEAIAAMKEATP